jgi:hypothetical protein
MPPIVCWKNKRVKLDSTLGVSEMQEALRKVLKSARDTHNS